MDTECSFHVTWIVQLTGMTPVGHVIVVSGFKLRSIDTELSACA